MDVESKKCPYCAEKINKEAIKCKFCGEILDPSMRLTSNQNTSRNERKWSPGVAALLSLIIPGAGQIYKGNIGTGLFWMIIVVIGYFFLIVPGLILHLICIVTAGSGNPYKD